MADDPTRKASEPPPLSLIYLDVDDEITSAATRIRAAAADVVVLVLPYGSRLATSRINFRLLAREATERGKTIQLVCADASARALAAAAGLPVHASVAAFEAHRSGGPVVAPDAGTAAGGNGATGNAGGRGATGAADQGGAAASTAATAATAGAWTAGATTAGSPPPGTPPTLGPAVDTQTRVLATPRRKSQAIPRVGPPRPPVRTGVAIGVGLALIVSIIAGGLLALELLPSATITLHPRAEAIGPLELSVEAQEGVAAPDPAEMTIPAQRFAFTVEATQRFQTTGIRIEEVKATGEVTFSNFDTGGGVLIPKGTVVRTNDDVEFETLSEITLPRARVDFFPPFPVRPSTETVGVEAVEAGPGGNVGNNTIVEVPDGGRNLRVVNDEPTSGGASNELPEVSTDDVEAAKAALTAALIAELDRQVAARVGIPAELTLFQETRTIDEPEYSVEPESLVGTTGGTFDIGATAEGSVLGVDAAPIRELAAARLATTVTDGWAVDPASVVTDIGEPAVIGTAIVYPVTIAATQVRSVDEGALVTAIRGLALPDARARLDDFGDVDIDVWPDWVTKIPTRADRVTFNLAAPQPSVAP